MRLSRDSKEGKPAGGKSSPESQERWKRLFRPRKEGQQGSRGLLGGPQHQLTTWDKPRLCGPRHMYACEGEVENFNSLCRDGSLKDKFHSNKMENDRTSCLFLSRQNSIKITATIAFGSIMRNYWKMSVFNSTCRVYQVWDSILSYLPTNSLTCLCFLDSDRKYKVPGSEKKNDLITHSTARSMIYVRSS